MNHNLDELMWSKNEFETNCVVKRHHQYLDIRSVYQTISCTQSFSSSQVVIMPKACRTSYNLALKLKIVAEAEAVENNSEIAREYGISESMVRRWRKDQANLFNGEIKLSAKPVRKTMDASRRSIRSSINEHWNGSQSRKAEVSFCRALILYFKTTETRSRNKSISWLQSEYELNAWLSKLS